MADTVFGLGARKADAALAAAVVVVLSIVVTADQDSGGSVDPLAYLWALGLGLLMLMRRTMPLVVLGLTVVGYFTYYASGFPAIGVAVPIAAALYSAAELGQVRAAVASALLVLAISTGFRLLSGQSAAYVVGYELVGHAALVASVIALGSTVRARRELLRRTEQVARLSAHQTLLHAEDRARLERMRLARELHDSIGHSLSVAALYTDVARESSGGPAQREALGLVRAAVSDSMSHLRSTVSLLRSSERLPASAPQLSQIAHLLEAPAAAGYTVRVDVDVDDAAVTSPAVRTTAYRVVQEAVTNVLRHSGGKQLDVTVTTDDQQRLVVSVSDDGGRSRPPRFTQGHGLAGMRERVAAVGGQLQVRTDEQGWHVHASLPMGEPT